MLINNKLRRINTHDGPLTIRKKLFLLPGAISVAWLVAALISSRPITEGLGLVLAQALLAVFTFRVLIKALSSPQAEYGPRLDFIIGLHVLIYYGLSNVIPALIPDLRPETLIISTTHRIPMSSVWAYSVATVAAALLLLGIIIGFQMASKLWPFPNLSSSRVKKQHLWLPPYNLAIIACVVSLITLVLGTIQHGIHFNAEMLKGETMQSLPLENKFIYHGLFYFLPIAPFLAATALVRAVKPSQKRLARCLLAFACLLSVAALMIWGMRSTAILALVLPLALLVHAGVLGWRKIALPAMVLVVIVYGLVTFIRGSELQSLLEQISDGRRPNLSEIASAIVTRTESQSVLERAIGDASYRTAGLEPAAALIQAQVEAFSPILRGKTIQSGFSQSLPVFLRQEFENPYRIKTVPAYLGVFAPGDWVTTFLAEFILDFGPYLLVFPAMLAGFGLALIDRGLLGLGQLPALKALLIIRFAFLLFIVSNGGSLAEMTLTFFKGTFGYIALFILLGCFSRFSSR